MARKVRKKKGGLVFGPSDLMGKLSGLGLSAEELARASGVSLKLIWKMARRPNLRVPQAILSGVTGVLDRTP